MFSSNSGHSAISMNESCKDRPVVKHFLKCKDKYSDGQASGKACLDVQRQLLRQTRLSGEKARGLGRQRTRDRNEEEEEERELHSPHHRPYLLPVMTPEVKNQPSHLSHHQPASRWQT